MRVKNNSTNSKVYVGQTLSPNQEYDIPAQELHLWQGDDAVIADLSTGILLIGDGVSYKPSGASAVNYLLEVDTMPKDADGSILYRTKAAKSGWSYQLHGISFTTSTINGFYNKDYLLNDLGFTTIKFYKSDGSEILTQADADLYCVRTEIDWMVNHEMEIIGGSLCQSSQPISDIYFWCILAPGIANVSFIQGGINLKYIGNQNFIDIDGRASKYIHPSIPVAGANKFRLIFRHDAGIKHSIQVLFDIFKP